ncbi:MAG: thymidine kinase [Sphaerochaetaceae bacterium]|nr:thymidine kinase [Sphaerochaetaceae bacterium]MDD4008016.1 thymidine kinase [Sphaerochaetaceae bacterium]MDD4397459.1 thymidine kinase [Sphaerochaetaceae bacterium]
MANKDSSSTDDFLKSLGFPSIEIHSAFTHFDFSKPGRRVLLIGPMGSGKTEFAARIWRDAAIAMKKSDAVKEFTATGVVDRRNVFFVRSDLDNARFEDYPSDALPYRGGYIRCGENIARIKDSFGLEQVLNDNPTVGTFIIDEASFFDERIAYVVRKHSLSRGVMFIFPTLILNFRKAIFNSTARLMLDMATDVIPLTAYCDHPDCLANAFYTYRYYRVEGRECPALFFDPLIVVGGDKTKSGSWSPNYCSRCDMHHFLPGKEYTFFTLKPLAEEATRGNAKPLRTELERLHGDKENSQLYRSILERYGDSDDREVYLNSILPDFIAEKALSYLMCEQNLLSEDMVVKLASDLKLNTEYLSKILSDNGRLVNFEQRLLF